MLIIFSLLCVVLQMHGGPARAKSFFDLVDADGDGLISYAEYMFFNTLLASTCPFVHTELQTGCCCII